MAINADPMAKNTMFKIVSILFVVNSKVFMVICLGENFIIQTYA
jgi:hypothetical protein